MSDRERPDIPGADSETGTATGGASAFPGAPSAAPDEPAPEGHGRDADTTTDGAGQPLDNPSAKVALSTARGKYRKGYQDITFPRYVRYIDDVRDMARIIRGDKDTDFSYDHDYHVQKTVLQASALPLD